MSDSEVVKKLDSGEFEAQLAPAIRMALRAGTASPQVVRDIEIERAWKCGCFTQRQARRVYHQLQVLAPLHLAVFGVGPETRALIHSNTINAATDLPPGSKVQEGCTDIFDSREQERSLPDSVDMIVITKAWPEAYAYAAKVCEYDPYAWVFAVPENPAALEDARLSFGGMEAPNLVLDKMGIWSGRLRRGEVNYV